MADVEPLLSPHLHTTTATTATTTPLGVAPPGPHMSAVPPSSPMPEVTTSSGATPSLSSIAEAAGAPSNAAAPQASPQPNAAVQTLVSEAICDDDDAPSRRALDEQLPPTSHMTVTTLHGSKVYSDDEIESLVHALVEAARTARNEVWQPVGDGAKGWSIRWRPRVSVKRRGGDTYWRAPNGDELRSGPDIRRWLLRGGVSDPTKHKSGRPRNQVRWAQCDACDKWRILPAGAPNIGDDDPWTCSMNVLDRLHNSCDAPEEEYVEETQAQQLVMEDVTKEQAQEQSVIEESGQSSTHEGVEPLAASAPNGAGHEERQEETASQEQGADDEAEDECDYLVIDGVSAAADRAADKAHAREEEAARALNGVPGEIDVLNLDFPTRGESMFCTAIVLSFDAESGKHLCRYTANEYYHEHEEVEDLTRQKWYSHLDDEKDERELLERIRADYNEQKKAQLLGDSTSAEADGNGSSAEMAASRPPMEVTIPSVGDEAPMDTAFGRQTRFGRNSTPKPRTIKCGVCNGCARDMAGPSVDCGECKHCLDMVKFGGPWRMRQKCLRRKCEAEIEAEERRQEEKRRKKQAEERRQEEKRRKKQADNDMWIDSYIRQRDRWEKEQRAKCEMERAARENRWAQRAEIKAKRRAAALAALEKKARKAAGRSDGKRKRSSSETAAPDMSPQPRPRPPPRVPEAILESNGQPGAAERFLVRWAKPPKPFSRPESSWEVARKLPAALLALGLEESRAVFNRKVEPRLTSDASLPDASGVVALNVPEDAARRMCTHLQEHWHGGRLPLSNGSACFGYATYGKTLSAHDAQQQAQHTLLMTHPLLPILRADVPGFTDIETFLTSWLHSTFGIVVELYFAHGLRQSPLTLKSTGFDVHQDTEDFPFIEYTIVVKLTPDAPGEPPSRMRVVGAPFAFDYQPAAGAAGAFLARLYHASVEPEPNTSEHLKVAFFFRASTKGERRVQRGLAATSGNAVHDEELAQRRHQVALELSMATYS